MRVASKCFHVSFCLESGSQAMTSTSSSKLSTPLRVTRSVFASKPFLFRSRIDKVSARAALGHTIALKVGHSSGIKHAKRKVKMCGPAPIVVELEQTLYMVWLSFNYAKTDMKISSALWPNVLYRDKCSHTAQN